MAKRRGVGCLSHAVITTPGGHTPEPEGHFQSVLDLLQPAMTTGMVNTGKWRMENYGPSFFPAGQLQSVFRVPTASFFKAFHISLALFQTGLCTIQHTPGTNQFLVLLNFDGIISLSMIC